MINRLQTVRVGQTTIVSICRLFYLKSINEKVIDFCLRVNFLAQMKGFLYWKASHILMGVRTHSLSSML